EVGQLELEYHQALLEKDLRLPLKIVLFPDLCVRAKIKMPTYSHICCAFYFYPSLTSEKIPNF
ncbi:MAG: hypothetical protein Q7T24_01475, partial [Deltaproteobacteria bacterium]|nr:hypothetical protein [Deltaproteobacteria bacterium]